MACSRENFTFSFTFTLQFFAAISNFQQVLFSMPRNSRKCNRPGALLPVAVCTASSPLPAVQHRLINQITPEMKGPLKRPTAPQRVKKFYPLYGNWKLISTLTTTRHVYPPWTGLHTPILFLLSPLLILSSIVCLALPCGICPLFFATKILLAHRYHTPRPYRHEVPLTMQVSPASPYSLTPTTKYLPQHPVFEYFQRMFFHSYEKPSCIPI
jgi:hypothetical protein